VNPEDIQLIDNALNNRLNETEISLFNEKMRQDDFRQNYLNFVLDERLIAKCLEVEKINHEKVTGTKQKLTILSTVIAIAAALLFAFILLQKPGIAIIQSSQDALVIRQGQELRLKPDFKLMLHDKILATAPLSFIYPDKTKVNFTANSTAIISQTLVGGKKIELTKGDLTADVQPQKKGFEMQILTDKSKALILGTKFTISSSDSKSNLEVHKGKVEFFNTTGSRDFVIGGEYAKARKDAPVISRQSFISNKKRHEDQAKWTRWKKHSLRYINDPDTIAYYDFEDINKNQVQTLHNKALVTKSLPLNGEIITTMAINGRWHQKGSLYFSEYGHVNFQKHPVYNISGPMTIFTWMKVKKFDRPWQTIISKGDGTWRLARNKHHNYMEFCCNGLKPGPGFLFGKKKVNDGKWHLLVGTYDGAKMKLYVDGELDVERVATGEIRTDDYPVNIGANARHQGRDFEGWIDELGILKRSMSAAEVKELYDAGRP
jgi:hypothetical protein